MEWLGTHHIPFSILFTKADKLSTNKLNIHITNYKNVLLEYWEEMPQYFITSSLTGQGKEEVLAYIHSVNQELIK